MSVLKQLQPQSVFHYFEELCAIPHGSGNIRAISEYCVNFAKSHNLSYVQDEMGNVILFKPATAGYEASPAVMLQGHLDMVAVKDAAVTDLDLEKDGLELVVDGDDLFAKGTSLGGDDGIAVAYGLALLAASDIPHPKLELVLTVDEEIGLLGAAGIDLSCCESKQLLNMDSEDEGIFLTSCAGGASVICTLPVVREVQSGVPVTFTVKGLRGGHSGVEIDKGRGNANQLLARFLYALASQCSFRLDTFEGGVKDNAIALQSVARVLLAEKQVEAAQKLAEQFCQAFQNELSVTDPDVVLVSTVEKVSLLSVLSVESTGKVISLVRGLPNGIQTMSAAIPGLVESSLNLGILRLEETTLFASCSVRSSVQSLKEEIFGRLENLTDLLGGQMEVQGDYPAWEYKAESRVRDIICQAYEDLYGKKAEIQAIHAGLECGFFAGKIPDLDCVSFGPQMHDIHTVQERLSISSTERVWNLLLETLKRLK